MAGGATQENGIVFFSEIDMIRDKDGNPKKTSDFPQWYFDSKITSIESEIQQAETALKMGYVSDANRPQMVQKLSQQKAELEKLVHSKPKLNGSQKDFLAKTLDELGQKIGEASFSRSEEMRGIADAHEEERRWDTKCFELTADAAKLAEQMQIPVGKHRMVTRTTAEIIWKIGRKALGEPTDLRVVKRN